MWKKIPLYLFYGICWGCLFFVVICIIFDQTGNRTVLEAVTGNFTRQALGSMLVGIACCSTSIVYQSEKLAMWQKVGIHFVVGMGVFTAVAFASGWLTGFSAGQMATFFLIAVLIFFLIWSGFYFYDRWEAKKMNERIKEMDREEH